MSNVEENDLEFEDEIEDEVPRVETEVASNPLEQDNEADAEDNDEQTNTDVKPKKVVRNPQPKLNDERLKGARGIHKLESLFEKVRFKGSGNEEEDLNTLMTNYEYWCHRLFPKLPFDDCLVKIEQLGYKKTVQTHIKKIRMNMLTEDETVNPILSDEDNAEVNMDTQNSIQPDIFDELLLPQTQTQITQDEPVQLTEEQLKRIKLNKERAEKLKFERLKQIQQKQFIVSDLLNNTHIDERTEQGDNSAPKSNIVIDKQLDVHDEKL